MATDKQLASYHGECSAVSFGVFDSKRALEFDPADKDYYENLHDDHGQEGGAVALVCLLFLLAMILFSLILCCCNHYWVDKWDFIGLARKGQNPIQRILGLLFVLGIVACTVLVTAMSVWGIVKVEQDVSDVVPKSFDFLEDSEIRLDEIHSNLTFAVLNGNSIVDAVRAAILQIRRDRTVAQLGQSGIDLSQNISAILTEMEIRTDDAEDALDTVDEEINANLDDLLRAMRDGIEYRDEGEAINDAGQIVVIAAFCLFILLSVVSTIASLCGASPCFTLLWASLMWFMLIIAFAIVGLLDFTKEISQETCLYIDTFAVKELRKEINTDPQRTEDLLWYYFRPASTEYHSPFNGNSQPRCGHIDERYLNLTQVEDLWGFPLTEVVEYLDTAETELYSEDGLRFPYNLGDPATQQALNNVRRYFPQARRDIAFVQDLIVGETFHDLHSDFKDIICCTELDAVETVWKAWVVSSVFGLVIAVLMTIQGYMSLKFGRKPAVGMPVSRVETQKTSAYMAPPVAEGAYMIPSAADAAPRNESVPLRQNQPQSSTAGTQSSVAYPSVQPPQAYY